MIDRGRPARSSTSASSSCRSPACSRTASSRWPGSCCTGWWRIRAARAFLDRVNKVTPLAQTLQQTSIEELPRTPKGPQRVIPGKPAKEGGPIKADVARASPWDLLPPATPGATLEATSKRLRQSQVFIETPCRDA